MDFSWTILAIVFAVNLFWITLMFAAQQLDKSLPLRHSLIPGTKQKFLYMQDWYTCTWGDMFALPFILSAFAHLAINGYIGLYQWILFGILVAILSVGFLVMCLGKDHKPDQGYPEVGKVSWQGILHLPHFGVAVAMSLLIIWHLILGHVTGLVLYLTLAGAVAWFYTFYLDAKTGNFDPLKKE